MNNQALVSKIAAVGDKNSVVVFKSLGVGVFGVESREDFQKFKSEAENYSVIFITEDIALKFKKEVEELSLKTLPAVLIIPGIKGGSFAGENGLKKIIERALGSELNI